MKKLLVGLGAALLIAGVAANAQAAESDTIAVSVTITLVDLSVSVTPESWTFTLPTDPATQACIATNDSTNRTEDILIQCGPGGTWLISDSAGSDTFVMTAVGGDLGSATSIHAQETLEAGVPAAGTVNFTLEFTQPTSSSVATDSMTVTLTAS